MSPIAERVRLSFVFVSLSVLLSGCASFAGLGPGDEETAAAGAEVVDKTLETATPEGQILAALQNTAAGESILTATGVSATAGDAYAAASGHLCRWVSLNYPGEAVSRQLACLYGGAWRWAAPVIVRSGN